MALDLQQNIGVLIDTVPFHFHVTTHSLRQIICEHLHASASVSSLVWY